MSLETMGPFFSWPLVSGQGNPSDVRRLSPAALAYVGDAVYELYMRSHYLFPPQRLDQYHRRVVAQVRAEQQAHHLRQWEPLLTAEEKDLVRRGRNGAGHSPKRLDAEIYRQATGLETLVGYLFLCDPQRLTELLGSLSLP